MVFEDVVGLPVTTVVTSPVMGVPVDAIDLRLGTRDRKQGGPVFAASATNRGVLYSPPPKFLRRSENTRFCKSVSPAAILRNDGGQMIFLMFVN